MLDLESFARLQAQLRRPFAQREDVLRAAHLDEDGLRMESAHWSALLAASESTALRSKYRAAYARASAAASAEPKVAAASPPPASSPPPAAPAEVEPPVVAPRREVASFMQAPLRAAPWAPMPAPVVAPPAAMIMTPPVATPPPVVAPHVIAPHVVGPPAVVAAPLAVAPPPIAPQPVTGTLPPATEDAPKRVPLAQRGTAPVDAGRMRSILDGRSTPFAGKTSPARLDELRSATPKPEPPAEKGRRQKATMIAKAIEVGATAPSKTLPFAKDGGDVPFPDLTVDRYAALAAELQAKGPTPSVLGRYAIASSEGLAALHAEHARRFAADPTLRARFEERKAHFLAFMAPTR